MGLHIQVENLNLSFHWNKFSRIIFQNLNLDIEQGSFVSVIGGNGSGKSSLLKLILGLASPDTGTISISGNPVQPGFPQSIKSNHVSYLAQQIEDLFFADTVKEELLYDQIADQKDAQEILLALGVNSLLDRVLDSLSGGERQALALAQFAVQESTLLILDEPSSYLDQARASWLKTYLEQALSRGKTILHVTQYPAEIKWGTHVIDLDDINPNVVQV